jgi:hypothetical protein
MTALLVVTALLGTGCAGGATGAAPGDTVPVAGRPAAGSKPPAPAYAPGWPAVHADAANSDYSPVEGAGDVSPAWQRDFDGSVSIGPLRWTINVGPTISPQGTATQTAGHKVYATVAADGGGNDVVIADPRTGTVLDREPIPQAAGFGVGTTVAADGTILVPMIAGRLAAYRPAR